MGSMSELMDRARHRTSVDEYHRMVEAGGLSHEDRVELIEGEIVDRAPIDSQHAYVVSQLARLFTLAAGENYLVSTRNPARGGRYRLIAVPQAGEYVRPVLLPGTAWTLVEGKTWSVPF